MLSNEDFADDTKDAGEIGAGTDVAALFEIELTEQGKTADNPFAVHIRYKDPHGDESQLFTKETLDTMSGENTDDFRFACAVAAFGHLLRGSEYTGEATLESVMQLAEGSLGRDPGGYRQEFLALLNTYKRVARG